MAAVAGAIAVIGTSLFTLLQARERWLAARFATLAQNVANADTPGYRARDLDPARFDRFVERLLPPPEGGGLRRTHPRHLPPPELVRTELRTAVAEAAEETVSGNTVVLAEEVRKLAEVEEQYRLAVRLFGKYRDMFRTAVRLQV